MSFGIRPTLRFASQKNLRRPLRKRLYAFLSSSYDHAAKFLVLLLCTNILFAGSIHVVCIELSEKKITKAHFQQYECRYPQKSEPGIFHLKQEHGTHVFLLSDILGSTPSCPECIDKHIQFKKPSTNSLS